MRNCPVCFGFLLFSVLLLNVLTVFSVPAGKVDFVVQPVNDWMDCFDIFGNRYIETIPHGNCSKFMKCVQDQYGSPAPVLQHCPGNLKFNFETCVCDWEMTAHCFDPENPDHKERRFHCACPLKDNGDGQWVPVDPEDDRCANGREDSRGNLNHH